MNLDEQSRKLWEQVLSFDIEEYQFNYGFALRLATEQKWSFRFTAMAITEYKKFMFLAARSEQMIAPSEIIDTVWHLHLIYSDSYEAFCAVLGKEIKHIPSRKQLEEQAKFDAARGATKAIYESVFGTMPDVIWKYQSMYESLKLSGTSYSLSKINILTLALFPILVVAFYFLLLPVYRSIDGVYFLPAYIALGLIIFMILKQYNQNYFEQLLNNTDASSFLFQLESLELIAFKSGHVEECVHALTNELVLNGNIGIGRYHQLSELNSPEPELIAQRKVYSVFEHLQSPVSYEKILSRTIRMPYFLAIRSFVDGLSDYMNTSKEYLRIVLLNYCTLGAFLLLGTVRVLTGVSAHKPMLYILFAVLVFLVIMVRFLRGMLRQFSNKILPDYYTSNIEWKQVESAVEWGYLQSGRLALTAAFLPVVGNLTDTDHHHSGTSSGSSCSSGCGSSCGSSGCGGCGD